jgi:tetratricopeptide (TPR) repeat protein
MIRNAVWNIYTEVGCTAYGSGYLPLAEKMFSAALEEAGEKWHPRLRLSISLNNLALVYRRSGFAERARSLYRRAVSLYDSDAESDCGLLRAIDSLADLHFHNGEYKQAKTFYRKSIYIFEELFGGYCPDLRQRLIRLSWIYANEGRHNDALRYYNRAQALKRS